MKLVNRAYYLNQLLSVVGTPDIKVITGIRRSGKSKLLESFMTHITNTMANVNVIHINFNLLEFENLLEYHALNTYVEAHYEQGKHNFVFIDEVQMCMNFEKAINSLHALEKYDLYITGSNAFLMSSDLATLFTGRTIEIEVFPFSFVEYLDYFPSESLQSSFDKYVKEGGMAGSYLYETMNQKYRYINDDVFNALVVRDILAKYKIRNGQSFNKLVDFLMDNVSNLTSVKKCAKILSSNDKTIGTYIDYLCRSFAFYRIRRYDLQGKKYLSTEDKFYLTDHAFRYARLGTKNIDFGRMYENIVAIELKRRGYEVYVGKLYKKEIDFVAMRRNEKIYIQVSDDISSEKTFQREVDSLLAIKDAYPKILLARTRHETYDYEGVKVIDLPEWLMNN